MVEQELVKDKAGHDVVLSQTGSYLKNLGQLTITANGQITTKLLSSVSTVQNWEVKELEDAWIAQIDAECAAVRPIPATSPPMPCITSSWIRAWMWPL